MGNIRACDTERPCAFISGSSAQMEPPSDVMKRIKGGTSKKVRELFPTLDEVYWGSTFWADGFMVKSVGEMTDKVVSHYIEEQRKS